MELNFEQCPLCGTRLSDVKLSEIQTKLRRQEQEKAAELTQAELALRRRLEDQFKRDLDKQKQALEDKARSQAEAQIKKVASELDLAKKKLKEAEAREAVIRKEVMEKAERERLKELANQRQSLDADKSLALLKQQSGFSREREALQKKLHLVERQLQKKTANELGDGAEIDLYETLRECFPTDTIHRNPKGQAGADITHEILYKGVFCGRIIIDCKNHQRWQSAFVPKLRQDQVNEGAEHAILATTVFPPGKKEMCIESDIIVISPARVPHITQLLRTAMVTMHVKNLSMKERSTKMARLYKLITSDSYSRKLIEVSKLTEEILDLDVQEKKTHDNTWKKRGTLAKRAQNVLREAETELAAVIESTDDEEMPPALGMKRALRLSPAIRSQKVV
jgi:hypothetical protein